MILAYHSSNLELQLLLVEDFGVLGEISTVSAVVVLDDHWEL